MSSESKNSTTIKDAKKLLNIEPQTHKDNRDIQRQIAEVKAQTTAASKFNLTAEKISNAASVTPTTTITTTATTKLTAMTAKSMPPPPTIQITAAAATNTNTKETTPTPRKRIESMTQDEILEENLKELLERQSREERRANGRLVAVIVAFLVIFLAVYHAWIRKTAVLAGVLVPAGIMLGYGGWVIILAKRDKQKRALFEKHLEEVALKNKTEMEAKMKLHHHGKKHSDPITTTKLHFENELQGAQRTKPGGDSASSAAVGEAVGSADRGHRKHKNKHRRQNNNSSNGGDIDGQNSSSSRQQSQPQKRNSHANKDLRVKRPSIRQKLFRQNVPAARLLTTAQVETTVQETLPATVALTPAQQTELQAKRKRLQRIATLKVPQLVRMGSAP